MPASLLASLRDLPFVCPRCRGPLDAVSDAYRCGPCGARYPIQAGIPDFRVFPDPYLSVEEDRERAQMVIDALDRLSFPELLEHYWSFSDVTPVPLRKRFVQTALRGKVRARRLLTLLAEKDRRRLKTVLEIGSGTGNFLAACAGVFPRVVGTDIAMRWLQLSRRRLSDEGLPEPALVCCCAESLPFPDGYFDSAFSLATLEFARDARRFFAESARVLAPGGTFFVNTVNRFSLAREPHVALWGVGYLPRRWQAAYVRWRRKASFENIRLLSRGEIDRLASYAFAQREFHLPEIGDEESRALALPARVAARIYGKLRGWKIVQKPVAAIAPEWNIRLEKA